MARTPNVKTISTKVGQKITIDKAADFRSIRADSTVPIGSPLDVTIILTRNEPGVMVQTVGAAVAEEIEGVQDMEVTNTEVGVTYVQAGHVIIAHDRAAELGGNLLRLIEALNPDLFRATLEKFGLKSAHANAS